MMNNPYRSSISSKQDNATFGLKKITFDEFIMHYVEPGAARAMENPLYYHPHDKLPGELHDEAFFAIQSRNGSRSAEQFRSISRQKSEERSRIKRHIPPVPTSDYDSEAMPRAMAATSRPGSPLMGTMHAFEE